MSVEVALYRGSEELARQTIASMDLRGDETVAEFEGDYGPVTTIKVFVDGNEAGSLPIEQFFDKPVLMTGEQTLRISASNMILLLGIPGGMT